MSLVVDSSVSLAWCFEDERSPAIMAILESVVESHAYVPVLWRFEFANGLLMAQRRGRLGPEKRLALLNEIGGLDLREDSQPRAGHWQAVSALASEYKLTVYDAAYLELAQRRQLPLATLDEALRKAARGAGLTLL